MDNPKIVRIELGILTGTRPRKAGCNSRLGEHGLSMPVPLIRITTEDGVAGFGRSRATRELAAQLLGLRLFDVFTQWNGPAAQWQPIEYPLWDLACTYARRPVYSAVAEAAGLPIPRAPWRVPCYDTSLYIDDLHLESDIAAADLIADEARQGYALGHRAFKIKIGRGARHMEQEKGMVRDMAVVCAVRAAVGPKLPIMVDVNNGYNLNLTKRFLSEAADCNLHWLEEPFHEDAVLYRDLREWLAAQGLSILIADGEGDASPRLMDWAREHLIDVIQRDVGSWGITALLPLAKQLDVWGVLSAPHHYGTGYGNYAGCHIAAACRNFAFAEWDETTIPGLDASGYTLREGLMTVPHAPGFGLGLDEAVFAASVKNDGFTLSC